MASLDFDNDNLFDFEDEYFSLMAMGLYDSGMLEQTKQSFLETRHFCREVLNPHVLEEDWKNAADPKYLSWGLLRLAAQNGQLTNFIPPFLGGTASGSIAIIGPIVEEQAAVDTAYCGLLGGHGLGLVALMMTFNFRVLQEIANKTVASVNSEKPYVIDCAITEPSAGTDVEEVELYPKAKLMCQAKKVPGGAILNGRKCFISEGHMATDHFILMPFDLKDPVNNYGAFLVHNNSKGFSVGHKFIKMGHRAAAVSELIFEDCFVPDKDIVMSPDEFPEQKYRGQFALLLEMVLGLTRVAVGAMGAGNARGSFERALAVAKTEKHKGRTLINQQWAQEILTNMYKNVIIARGVYMEASFANMVNLSLPGVKSMPAITRTKFMKNLFQNDWFKKIFHSAWLRKKSLDGVLGMDADARSRIQFMSSMAKVVGSDMAMENGHLAVEFLGRSGLRHDMGIEKGYRDAKLLQIFEGTNQLNRLNIFKHKVARHVPGVEVF